MAFKVLPPSSLAPVPGISPPGSPSAGTPAAPASSTVTSPGSGGGGGGGWGGGSGPEATIGNPYAPIALQAALMAASPQADAQQAQANASSPGLSRLTSPQPAASMSTSQPAPGQDVWVTVPVDKVEVGPSGKGTVTPLYAQASGYQSPGQGNAIPPVSTTGARGVPQGQAGTRGAGK
jgi:hypothetical protein